MTGFIKGVVICLSMVFLLPIAVYIDPEGAKEALSGKRSKVGEAGTDFGVACGITFLSLYFWWTVFVGVFQ